MPAWFCAGSKWERIARLAAPGERAQRLWYGIAAGLVVAALHGATSRPDGLTLALFVMLWILAPKQKPVLAIVFTIWGWVFFGESGLVPTKAIIGAQLHPLGWQDLMLRVAGVGLALSVADLTWRLIYWSSKHALIIAVATLLAWIVAMYFGPLDGFANMLGWAGLAVYVRIFFHIIANAPARIDSGMPAWRSLFFLCPFWNQNMIPILPAGGPGPIFGAADGAEARPEFLPLFRFAGYCLAVVVFIKILDEILGRRLLLDPAPTLGPRLLLWAEVVLLGVRHCLLQTQTLALAALTMVALGLRVPGFPLDRPWLANNLLEFLYRINTYYARFLAEAVFLPIWNYMRVMRSFHKLRLALTVILTVGLFGFFATSLIGAKGWLGTHSLGQMFFVRAHTLIFYLPMPLVAAVSVVFFSKQGGRAPYRWIAYGVLYFVLIGLVVAAGPLDQNGRQKLFGALFGSLWDS